MAQQWPLLNLSFLRKYNGPDRPISISIQRVSPRLQHQTALFKVLSLISVGSTTVDSFLMAHLTRIAFASNWLINELSLNSEPAKTTKTNGRFHLMY